MVLNILLAIVGLIVGLGLGFVIAKSRHDKAINGAKRAIIGLSYTAP